MTTRKERDHSLGDYSIKMVTSTDEFKKLKIIWDELATNEGSYFPFLCFDFFRIWLEHFLADSKLLILQIDRGDRVLAIAPFVIKQGRYKGVNTIKIELIGNVYSPIRFFMFAKLEKEEKEVILLVVLDFFKKIYKRWDIIDLNSIIEEHENLSIVKSALSKSGLKNNEYFCFGNCYEDGIQFPSDIYFKSLSKNFRASIRKNRNRAQEKGKLEFQMITGCEGLEGFLELYFKVYEKSWKERERLGPEYLMDHIKDLAEKGWLRLGLVYLNRAPIAVGFGAAYGGVAYLEKTAYDEEFENIGAGKLWYAEMIKYLIDVDKVTCIDLLIGDYEYKKNWVSRRRERKGVLIFNKRLKGIWLNLMIVKLLPSVQGYRCLRKIKELIARRLMKNNLT